MPQSDNLEQNKAQKELKPREIAFANAWIKHKSASKAALEAGYSPTCARRMGSKLYRMPHIRACIDKMLAAASAACLVNSEYVIDNLKEIVERCMQAKPFMIFNPVKRRMEQDTALVEYEDEETKELKSETQGIWCFDAQGANKALELLGRNLKMFSDKLEIKEDQGLAARMKKAREYAAIKRKELADKRAKADSAPALS